MRALIISDIHANLVALEAVLAQAGSVDAVWCLGDVIGYGPKPNECVEIVRELPNLICLQGNHDAAATGDLSLDSFNPEARKSLEWQGQALTEEARDFLMDRPRNEELGGFTLVHASPRQPILEYLLDSYSAFENFDFFESDYCLVGHTHIPVLFSMANGTNTVSQFIPKPGSTIQLQRRCIINPGSVGQPRDRDSRAAFAILDTEKAQWDYQRVEYDIASVQQQMRDAGLPARHIERLMLGW